MVELGGWGRERVDGWVRGWVGFGLNGVGMRIER